MCACEYPRLRAMLRARIVAYAPGPHFLIHGTKGSFVKYGMDPQEELCAEKTFRREKIGARTGEKKPKICGGR